MTEFCLFTWACEVLRCMCRPSGVSMCFGLRCVHCAALCLLLTVLLLWHRLSCILTVHCGLQACSSEQQSTAAAAKCNPAVASSLPKSLAAVKTHFMVLFRSHFQVCCIRPQHSFFIQVLASMHSCSSTCRRRTPVLSACQQVKVIHVSHNCLSMVWSAGWLVL